MSRRASSGSIRPPISGRRARLPVVRTCVISVVPDTIELRGPGMRNLDFAIFKNFHIKETANEGFTGGFHALNTP